MTWNPDESLENTFQHLERMIAPEVASVARSNPLHHHRQSQSHLERRSNMDDGNEKRTAKRVKVEDAAISSSVDSDLKANNLFSAITRFLQTPATASGSPLNDEIDEQIFVDIDNVHPQFDDDDSASSNSDHVAPVMNIQQLPDGTQFVVMSSDRFCEIARAMEKNPKGVLVIGSDKIKISQPRLAGYLKFEDTNKLLEFLSTGSSGKIFETLFRGKDNNFGLVSSRKKKVCTATTIHKIIDELSDMPVRKLNTALKLINNNGFVDMDEFQSTYGTHEPSEKIALNYSITIAQLIRKFRKHFPDSRKAKLVHIPQGLKAVHGTVAREDINRAWLLIQFYHRRREQRMELVDEGEDVSLGPLRNPKFIIEPEFLTDSHYTTYSVDLTFKKDW